jgi:hypothetical protein
VFDNSVNFPCTAELEVEAEKLIAYFERKAKENTKRAQDKEKEYLYWKVQQDDRSSYYFSGKADSYQKAADKLRELLPPKVVVDEAKEIPESASQIFLGLRNGPHHRLNQPKE